MQDNVTPDEVSRVYQQLSSSEPPAEIDHRIRQAAQQEMSKVRRKSWLVPSSIAASVILAVGVVATATYRNTFSPEVAFHKQPMQVMQRAKPESPAVMLNKIEQLLAAGSSSEAGVAYHKFRLYYPAYPLQNEMTEALRKQKIIE